MPAYNVEPVVGEAIQSVIDQTYARWELWVIDDGSTDDTAAVVEPYLYDERIHYVYQENQERCVARNHGFRRSTGDYITFLDADDLWLPEKLELQVSYLDTHPKVGLCFTYACILQPSGDPFPRPYSVHLKPGQDPFYQLLRHGNFIAVGSELTRRGVYEERGPFDETMPVCANEDWELWLRVARCYPIHFIDRITLLRRVHGDNTSVEDEILGGEAVLQRVFADPDLPTGIAAKKAEVYARFHVKYSRRYLSLRQRKAAFRQWRLAVRAYPLGILALNTGWKATLELCLPHRWMLSLRGSIQGMLGH
jgi:glycosyltransferase involved in cell wall biosynthesis